MLSLRGRILLKLTFIKSNIHDWFTTFYLDFTSAKYSNIQYMICNSVRNVESVIDAFHRLTPCKTFTRYYLFSKYWTPIMQQINPATIPLKRPVKLGRRWGGDAWLKKQY